MATELAIVDSGGANISSLAFAMQRLGVATTLTTDPDTIRSAQRVILPGVGAAADAMAKLRRLELTDVIRSLTQPVLGICLGMQLLARHTEEQDTPMLGTFPEVATRLAPGPGMPVPNMGWCRISKSGDHPLLHGIPDGSFFYFLHSYALPPGEHCLASASHTTEFCAAAASANFHAVQFHPERSQAAGARLLQNFVNL